MCVGVCLKVYECVNWCVCVCECVAGMVELLHYPEVLPFCECGGRREQWLTVMVDDDWKAGVLVRFILLKH